MIIFLFDSIDFSHLLFNPSSWGFFSITSRPLLVLSGLNLNMNQRKVDLSNQTGRGEARCPQRLIIFTGTSARNTKLENISPQTWESVPPLIKEGSSNQTLPLAYRMAGETRLRLSCEAAGDISRMQDNTKIFHISPWQLPPVLDWTLLMTFFSPDYIKQGF